MQVYITEKPSVAKALADYFNKNGANFKKLLAAILIVHSMELLPGL